ncbi:MAG: TIGR02569 family protein [Nakamurella sp.]
MTTPPAEHVRAAFGVAAAEPELLSGGQGTTWRCDDTVLKPTTNTAETAWIASTFEHLQVDGVRLSRPIRSMDGRWVVGGWTAQRFVAGRADDRYTEILETGDRLHEALAEIREPRFLRERDDLYSWADKLAWGEIEDTDGKLGGGHGAKLFAELAAGRAPVSPTATAQVVHGDLFGNVLFAASAPPAVVDITPYWRPPSWAAAVIVVDAISWGGATTDLVEGSADRQDFPEMLRRALLFRLAVSLAHPRSTAESLVEMLSAAEVLDSFLNS